MRIGSKRWRRAKLHKARRHDRERAFATANHSHPSARLRYAEEILNRPEEFFRAIEVHRGRRFAIYFFEEMSWLVGERVKDRMAARMFLFAASNEGE